MRVGGGGVGVGMAGVEVEGGSAWWEGETPVCSIRHQSTLALVQMYMQLQMHVRVRLYRIAGKFGEDFNLAVWRIIKNRQIKSRQINFSSIM